ncbi:MAG TPA: hypothetical protein VK742_03530 [Candidatus Sulfotelmatobacter sp.]|jgi:hypothetical protein|nr:hypothetical protein [Candidatus Sulfotelmatobacter sp.]
MSGPTYTRLTRERVPRQFTFSAVSAARSSLWLGDDHLLLVDRNGYTETYKRFYFRDIQAFIIRATKTRMTWNWILGIPAGLCLMFVIFLAFDVRGFDAGAITIICIVAAICGIPLFFNNLFGTTCACQIRTAVQTEELPSLCRLRQTRKVLDKIRPLVATAQGQLSPEEASSKMMEAALAEAAKPPVVWK